MQQATIKIMFHLPDRRRRDGFGLLERMKPWLDGLVQGKMPVLRDDDLRTIGFPIANWCWDPRHPQTVIEITEVGGRSQLNISIETIRNMVAGSTYATAARRLDCSPVYIRKRLKED